jgi:hypothetical protein
LLSFFIVKITLIQSQYENSGEIRIPIEQRESLLLFCIIVFYCVFERIHKKCCSIFVYICSWSYLIKTMITATIKLGINMYTCFSEFFNILDIFISEGFECSSKRSCRWKVRVIISSSWCCVTRNIFIIQLDKKLRYPKSISSTMKPEGFRCILDFAW